jgi:aldose 1-epimerase
MSRILELISGNNSASISSLAGSLIGLRLGDKVPIPMISNGSSSFAGEILAPWPNRIEGGRYEFDGKSFEIAAKDELGNALHGFLHNVEAKVLQESSSSATLEFQIAPSTEYPGSMAVTISYLLSEAGLEVVQTAINNGSHPAPIGLGAHPYFAISDSTALLVQADFVSRHDPSMIPKNQDPLSSVGLSTEHPTKLAGLDLDHEFSGLKQVEGIASTYLLEVDGSGFVIWQRDADYVMVYTSDAFNFDSGPARAVAVEPQTCAVNAFNNQRGLSVLEPGQSLVLNWGVGLV